MMFFLLSDIESDTYMVGTNCCEIIAYTLSFNTNKDVFHVSEFILLLFRKQSLPLGRNDLVQLKEAYKWITHPLFSEGLGIPIDGKVSDLGTVDLWVPGFPLLLQTTW